MRRADIEEELIRLLGRDALGLRRVAPPFPRHQVLAEVDRRPPQCSGFVWSAKQGRTASTVRPVHLGNWCMPDSASSRQGRPDSSQPHPGHRPYTDRASFYPARAQLAATVGMLPRAAAARQGLLVVLTLGRRDVPSLVARYQSGHPLGHHDLKETARYLHLSQRHLHATPSPLDALVLKKGRSSEEE